jgi:D-cysteine desulfhydrase
VRASAELATQLAELDEQPTGLWLATGSCGTQAGLLVGAALAGARYRVWGVTVSRPVPECQQRVRMLAARAAELASAPADLAGAGAGTGALAGASGAAAIGEPDVLGGWIGPGYGVPSAAGQAAARLVAQTEGIFLDPAFGAKAMAALIAECRAGRVRGPQVFLVSGGAPTLFAGAGL